MKLTYFDFDGGRGEDCRLALHVAGVEFEDDRLVGQKWSDVKPHTPWGNLPVLTTEQGQLGQSNAILVYVGRRYGLHPSEPWEAARHEAVISAVEDARHRLAEKTDASSEETKKASREAFASGWLAMWAAKLEAQIRGPFVGGDEIQVADLKLSVLLSFYKRGGVDHISPEFFAAYPKIAALHDAVLSHEGVKSWYAHRASQSQ